MDAIASLWMQLWSDTQTLHQALTILIFLTPIRDKQGLFLS